MHNTRPRRARAGFTLIELLVVIVIIGMLATLAIPKLNQIRTNARKAEVRASLSDIQKALEAFGVDHNGQYPFRLRYYDEGTVNSAGFDQYDTDNFPPALHTEPSPPPVVFSLGLIGGVRTVHRDFTMNTGIDPNEANVGINEHKVIQPYGFDDTFYRRFNQYSDPLVALGYLTAYPENPFLRRPMGAISWGYGEVPTSPGVIDKTIPAERVLPTPGDFVYTFYYRVENGAILPPQGVNPSRKSYKAKSETMDDPDGGLYYIDTVDSYQLWAYGNLPLNGGTYECYPNNDRNKSNKGMREADRDWDNSNTRDMFEIGLCAYFKSTGGSGSQQLDTGGKKLEY